MDDIQRSWRYRMFEILPGAISWTILLGPPVLAIWEPQAAAFFILIYIVLWFSRAIKLSIFFTRAYLKTRVYKQIDWNRALRFFSNHPPSVHTAFEEKTVSHIEILKKEKKYKTSEQIYHVVLIATYKEEKDILHVTSEALTKVDYPLEKLIVVLATEERDQKRAKENAEYLQKTFGRSFGQFHHIMHPKDLPNELPAKGANISYAGRRISQMLIQQGHNPSNVLVTTLDADNRVHPQYFSILTYHYLVEPNRDRCSYQPLAFFYNNIWDVPFTNRIVALANTFWYLGESGESQRMFTASSYAQSLDTLIAIDFWSRSTIVEDLQQFWRVFFHFKGTHHVVPLFIPIYQDALQNRTYFTSLLGQYKQLRRWAWGSSILAYAILKMWQMRRQLPVFLTLRRIGYLTYLQITWATAPIVVLFNKNILDYVNPEFSKSFFAYNFGALLGILFTVMSIVIFISILISLLTLPPPRGRLGKWRFVLSVGEWILVPFVTIIYGSIPALDAQTRLMLNKPLAFGVTEKIRKLQ